MQRYYYFRKRCFINNYKLWLRIKKTGENKRPASQRALHLLYKNITNSIYIANKNIVSCRWLTNHPTFNTHCKGIRYTCAGSSVHTDGGCRSPRERQGWSPPRATIRWAGASPSAGWHPCTHCCQRKDWPFPDQLVAPHTVFVGAAGVARQTPSNDG